MDKSIYANALQLPFRCSCLPERTKFMATYVSNEITTSARKDPGFWNGGWIFVIVSEKSNIISIFEGILFQYLRNKKKKRKKGAQNKGGENSPISPPLDPRLKCTIVPVYLNKLYTREVFSKKATNYKNILTRLTKNKLRLHDYLVWGQKIISKVWSCSLLVPCPQVGDRAGWSCSLTRKTLANFNEWFSPYQNKWKKRIFRSWFDTIFHDQMMFKAGSWMITRHLFSKRRGKRNGNNCLEFS